MAMKFHDYYWMDFVGSLRNAPGETVEERTEFVLCQRGWDKHIDEIPNDECRTVVTMALQRLALRHESAQSAADMERTRNKKEKEKIAALGLYGDLFADQYVGFTPDELASRLPHETYWVESLGKCIPREDLAHELAIVAELRKVSQAEFLRIQNIANVYRHELAIFDELLRQGSKNGTSAQTAEVIDQ